MTTTALPTDPTQLPAGPDRVNIEALHLSINQTWESGSSHNIHLLENGDLGVVLLNGQTDRLVDGASRSRLPATAERGTIVIALNVDEGHYSNAAFVGGPKKSRVRPLRR